MKKLTSLLSLCKSDIKKLTIGFAFTMLISSQSSAQNTNTDPKNSADEFVQNMGQLVDNIGNIRNDVFFYGSSGGANNYFLKIKFHTYMVKHILEFCPKTLLPHLILFIGLIWNL
jgi:hypothetical protein